MRKALLLTMRKAIAVIVGATPDHCSSSTAIFRAQVRYYSRTRTQYFSYVGPCAGCFSDRQTSKWTPLHVLAFRRTTRSTVAFFIVLIQVAFQQKKTIAQYKKYYPRNTKLARNKKWARSKNICNRKLVILNAEYFISLNS